MVKILNVMGFDFAFLDSGTGGIPYMLELKKKMPSARVVYLGDTVHFPYGEKSVQEITDCASNSISKIISLWNPKTIVIACNTISVTALSSLRQRFPEVPIVGTVPAIKLAAKVSRNKKIGFLATNASVNHPYSKKLAEDFASDCTVVCRGDPELIDFIEHKLFTSSEEEKLKAVRPAVDFFKAHDCDTIILGCTHFTHLAGEIQIAAGNGVKVVDSREGVSNQAIRVESDVKEKDLHETSDADVKDMTFFVTAGNTNQISEYQTMCNNFHIPFGGIVE